MSSSQATKDTSKSSLPGGRTASGYQLVPVRNSGRQIKIKTVITDRGSCRPDILPSDCGASATGLARGRVRRRWTGAGGLGPAAPPGPGPRGSASSRRRSGAGAGQGFGQFDHVAPRVAEECEPAADGLDLERFAQQVHAAGGEFGAGLVNAGHAQAEVLVAAVAEALAKVVQDRPGM